MGRIEIDTGDLDRLLAQPRCHPIGQGMEIGRRIKSAPDPRLVGDDDQQIALGPGGAKRLEHAGQKDKIRRRVDVAALLVENAVPVEE